MKCPTCRGPLTRIQPVTRSKSLVTLYRCIVCGSDVEVTARRRTRRRLLSAHKPAKMKLVRKAS